MTLFEHDTRPLKLTSSGRKLLHLGEELLQQNALLFASMKEDHLQIKKLSLGLGESAAGSFGPWLIANLNKKIDEVEVISGLTRPLVRALRERRLDFLLSPEPPSEKDGLEGKVIFEEDYLFVVKRNSPLTNSMNDFRQFTKTHPLIEYNNESSDKYQARRLFKSALFNSNVHTSVSTSYLLVGLVKELDGWSVITPTNLWSSGPFLREVDFYQIPQNHLTRRYWLIWKSPQPESVKKIITEAISAALIDHFLSLVSIQVPRLGQFIRPA